MQFDFFDKKIREAADRHHPSYDEQAWKRMRKLLDRHMPEEEENRRGFLFLIPLFLLLGGGIWYFTQQGRSKKAPPVAGSELPAEKISPVNSNRASPAGELVLGNEQTIPGPGADNDEMKIERGGESVPLVNRQNPHADNPAPATGIAHRKTVAEKQSPPPGVLNEAPAERHNEKTAGQVVASTAQNLVDDAKEPEKSETVPAAVAVSGQPAEKKGNDVASANESTPQKGAEPGKRKKKTSLASRFFFFGAAGPDLSFTREMGETRMFSGVGAGFQLNDRLMVRTGFFSARKVYSAQPDEYEPPDNFWSYYPNLEKIDADCRVYEIPLLVSYRFGKSEKQSWMATAGISTYFMKEEKYRYYYKPYPTAPTTTRDYTINNQFEHHFSVLTLSGGYKRNIGKRVTLTAEPYLKVPLQGIGFGKVKLNSGGVMFSVGVRPFGN